MAATLAFRGQVDLEQVLQAASWRSHNTFTNHYLKDLSEQQEGLRKLGPLVVAQHVVHK